MPKKSTTTVFLLLSVFSFLRANDCYVTEEGAGLKDGSDWNNACAGTGGIHWDALAPGATLWLAGGNYSGFHWGKSAVTLKRATSNNPEAGQAPGWQPAYDSQVVINVGNGPWEAGIIVNNYDSVTVDGQVRDGIRFLIPASEQDPGTGGTDVHLGIYGGGHYAALRNLYFEGPNTEFSAYGINWGLYKGVAPSDGLVISHCRFFGINTSLFLNYINGAAIEYCEVENQKGNYYNHDNSAFINNCYDGVIRCNYFHFFYSLAVFFSGTYGPGSDRWKIYGNVWYNPFVSGTAISFDNNNDAVGTPIQLGSDWQFYNNTIVHVAIGFRTDSRYPETYWSSVAGGQVYNNIFCQTSFAPGLMTHDYNYSDQPILGAAEAHGIIYSGNPFVDTANADFHLAAGSQPIDHGLPLDSEFATDKDGNTRGADGTWDLGAYEYVPEGIRNAEGGMRDYPARLLPSNPVTTFFLREYLRKNSNMTVYNIKGREIAIDRMAQGLFYLVPGQRHDLAQKIVVIR